MIRSVRPWPSETGGTPVDVVISDGRIAAIGPAAGVDAASGPDVPSADGRGGVLIPAFADVHAHLDSTRLGLPFRPHSAGPGLTGLIENDRANWRADDDVGTRATRTLGATIASGTTVVRSHAQVDTDARLERLEGVLAARDAHADRCQVQIVAFPQSGIVRDRGTADLLNEAILVGADLIGGIDPCGLDRDPVEHLDIVFGLADRHHVQAIEQAVPPGALHHVVRDNRVKRVVRIRRVGQNGRTHTKRGRDTRVFTEGIMN